MVQKSKNLPKCIYFDFETWVEVNDGNSPDMLIAQYANGREFCFPKNSKLMADTDAVAEKFGK